MLGSVIAARAEAPAPRRPRPIASGQRSNRRIRQRRAACGPRDAPEAPPHSSSSSSSRRQPAVRLFRPAVDTMPVSFDFYESQAQHAQAAAARLTALGPADSAPGLRYTPDMTPRRVPALSAMGALKALLTSSNPAVLSALFDSIDANHDGLITPGEAGFTRKTMIFARKLMISRRQPIACTRRTMDFLLKMIDFNRRASAIRSVNRDAAQPR